MATKQDDPFSNLHGCIKYPLYVVFFIIVALGWAGLKSCGEQQLKNREVAAQKASERQAAEMQQIEDAKPERVLQRFRAFAEKMLAKANDDCKASGMGSSWELGIVDIKKCDSLVNPIKGYVEFVAWRTMSPSQRYCLTMIPEGEGWRPETIEVEDKDTGRRTTLSEHALDSYMPK